MRARDWECIRATIGDITPETFAVGRFQSNGPAWFIEQAGQPVCIFGIELVHDRYGVAWLACTDEMHSFKKLFRFSLTVANNAFSVLGMARIEAQTLAGWVQAEAFADRLGLKFEGTRRNAGINGESFHVF